jgi:hypothetical protein
VNEVRLKKKLNRGRYIEVFLFAPSQRAVVVGLS